MYIGQGLNELLKFMFVALCVFVPLGMWKLIEIIVWVFNHVKVAWVST